MRERWMRAAGLVPEVLVVVLGAVVSAVCGGGDDLTGPGTGFRMDIVVSAGGVLSATDAGFEQITVLDSDRASYPRHSPDGRFLAYIDLEDLQHKTIRVLDRSARTVAELDLGTELPNSIAWGHDGRFIYYGLFFANGARWRWRDDAEPTQLFYLEPRDQIAHSPTGPLLAVTRDGAIWVQPSAGVEPVNLTADRLPGATVHRPRWSPDGSRFVFVVSYGLNDPRSGLYSVEPDGDGLQQLTSGEHQEYRRAVFSPNGSALLVVRDKAGSQNEEEIAIVPLDGSTATSVQTRRQYSTGDFSWR